MRPIRLTGKNGAPVLVCQKPLYVEEITIRDTAGVESMVRCLYWPGPDFHSKVQLWVRDDINHIHDMLLSADDETPNRRPKPVPMPSNGEPFKPF